MAHKCKECRRKCTQCTSKQSDVHLHVEIENLRRCLQERDSHIATMETHFLKEADKFPNGEMASVKEDIIILQDKYDRLYDAYKRIQKVNQNLEDKLLKIVDKCETEKCAFTKDIATLSHTLADAKYTIRHITQDNEKYKGDMSLAVQLLQCNPSNFVSQKYETLPPDVQAQVRTYIAKKNSHNEESTASEVKSITVPISTFPPTAMIYNISKTTVEKNDDTKDDAKPSVDVVSASIMAKVLEERLKERTSKSHYGICTCSKSILKVDMETQTEDDFQDHDQQSSGRPSNFFDYTNGSEKNQKNSQDYHRVKLNNYEKLSEHQTMEFRKNLDANKICLGNDSFLNNEIEEEEEAEKWCMLGGKSTKDLKNLDSSRSSWKEKEKIVDERLWKNTWMASRNQRKNETGKEFSEMDKIEVINDRVWKINRIWKDDYSKIPEVTLIEVKSPNDSFNQSPINGQTEATVSSSFSSDSVVISTSDPSSLSSDICKPSNEIYIASGDTYKANNNRDQDSISLTNEKKSGPRNCLVRVRSGSKNILLDNAGSYQTVLYTTGMDPSPKRQDGQLQRVAEWVESSVEIKFENEISPLKKFSRVSNRVDKDLISFETSSDEDKSICGVMEARDSSYKVKITKEMEENYLKLAASLDPVALSLASSTGQDLTIEKYRMDSKKKSKTESG